MTDNQKEKCAHPSCGCPPAADSKFCSALCEGNQGISDIICGCNHPECKTTA